MDNPAEAGSRQPREVHFFFRTDRAIGYEYRRGRAGPGQFLNLFDELQRANIFDMTVNDDSVEILLLHYRQGLAAGADADDVQVRSGHGPEHAVPFHLIGAHQEQLLPSLMNGLLDRLEGLNQGFVRDGFFEIGHGAQRESKPSVLVT